MPQDIIKFTLFKEGEAVKVSVAREGDIVETYPLNEEQRANVSAFVTDLVGSLSAPTEEEQRQEGDE